MDAASYWMLVGLFEIRGVQQDGSSVWHNPIRGLQILLKGTAAPLAALCCDTLWIMRWVVALKGLGTALGHVMRAHEAEAKQFRAESVPESDASGHHMCFSKFHNILLKKGRT